MAGSLLRPPLKINPLTEKNSSSINNSAHNKSIKKYQRKLQQHQHLKGKHNSSNNSDLQSHQRNPQQLKHLLKLLKYCQQRLSYKKLLFLLFLATNDSRWWTAFENKKNCNNLRAIVTATKTTNIFALNYEEKQQQLLQQPQLQFNNKLYESTKKFRKNLLNRKKFQLQLQLKEKGDAKEKTEKLFNRENQSLEKSF